MSLHSRLRQLATALPSDSSAVTFTRGDLRAMLDEGDVHESELILRDLRVEEVADETCRSPSTVRTWLISGQLRGYKLQGRTWRVPRSALRAFLDDQPFNRSKAEAASDEPRKVDLGAWRRVRRPTEWSDLTLYEREPAVSTRASEPATFA